MCAGETSQHGEPDGDQFTGGRVGIGGLANSSGTLVQLAHPQGQAPPAAPVMRSDSPGTLKSATLFLAGGLATVIYTDALQTAIMVVGAVILAVKGEVWGLGAGELSLHLEL